MGEETESDYVNALFSKHRVDGFRELFKQHTYAKVNIPRDINMLIHPTKLTVEEKSVKAGTVCNIW